MKSGDIIEFNHKKQFRYVKSLGEGGTGDTHLFLDDTTNIYFAIKKYSPKQKEYTDDLYNRFVEEIKILFNLSHPNIVRIYNYYLYPELKLGYLQMEYIDGVSIDDYTPAIWDKDWETIFEEAVSAFKHLEKNHILHRDIRPANILIDKNENVKIIDFGFGKILKGKEDNGKSIFLNWPVTEIPDEVALNGIYSHQSEIYFLGKLFQHLIKQDGYNFRYNHILEKMIELSPDDRYSSFEEVEKDISQGVLGELEFSDSQKKAYQNFANALTSHITNYDDKYFPVEDIQQTMAQIADLIRKSALENYIQDNSLLIGAFIRGGYRYNAKKDIEVVCVRDFYKLVKQLDERKQKIVLDNIYLRLSNIKVVNKNEDDELPF